MVPLELGRGQVAQHQLLRHLRVVDVEQGTVADEALAHIDGRRLARVAGVLQRTREALSSRSMPADEPPPPGTAVYLGLLNCMAADDDRMCLVGLLG